MDEEPKVEENVPVEFNIRTTYSTVGTALQKGSRYAFAPAPTAVEYEIVFVGGDEWIVWVWHTPEGVHRYAMPKATAKQSWEQLGRALGSETGLTIATRLPMDGHHPQQG
jgi:hypothetical protein